jgi:DNA polymerase/3'-5' exonuclease PolX
MSDKPKFDAEIALGVARELCATLRPVTERLIVAGSLRRRKALVGDVEILYVPKTQEEQDGLFDTRTVNMADATIARLESEGVLERRKNINGSEMFGEKNKLMRHRGSGVPVDLFAATAENWWNYLVCRTGPADSNTRICMAAQARGWKWNPYGVGFSRPSTVTAPGEERRMESERDVFEFVGLPFSEPWERA